MERGDNQNVKLWEELGHNQNVVLWEKEIIRMWDYENLWEEFQEGILTSDLFINYAEGENI